MAKFDPQLIPPRPEFKFEIALWEDGHQFVAGIDEAGRGALAGPVAAAAVVFSPDPQIAEKLKGVRDSKQMSPIQRAEWGKYLPGIALTWGVGYASAEEIDSLGILPATRMAARRAIKLLSVEPEHLLLDYLKLGDVPIPQTSLVKGDARSLSIAAASIMAKTSRDLVMCKLGEEYPGYDFARHKGYGTVVHRAALERLGPCPEHRQTFKPLSMVEG
ncbi:MAG: ribonuclease HII [Anaerolineales bacterium]|jgi:ribonuclease HII